MLCRQGPSERYAPLGLSFPPLPRRAPSHEAADGYAAPNAPAGQPCLDDEYFSDWPRQYDIDLNQINAEWYHVKLRCLSKNGNALARQTTRNCEVVYVIGRKPLVFDPLGNGNLALRINYQKVSRLNESQEVASKWGLGRSTSFHTACNILAYNMLQLHDQNWQMSRGSKTKYRKIAWAAVWARHWSARNRSRKTRGLKKTTHRMCRDGIIWPVRIQLSCYLKLQNKIAERT